VDGAPLDFRKPKSLRDGQGNPLGVDNSLVFESTRNIEEPAAMLASPDGAVTLKLWTDQPGLHGMLKLLSWFSRDLRTIISQKEENF
jgi:aldose 1-epimerase